jgi:hypothetical protein
MIFSKRRDPERAIGAFWAWWPQARPRIEQAIAAGDWSDGIVAEVSARVGAIDPNLEWEFGRGTRAAHVLSVTAVGDRALRATAERWRRAGPLIDGDFEFAASRQPNLSNMDSILRLDGHDLALADLRYTVWLDSERAEVDVGTWHPAFASLPEPARLKVTMLSLDWLLGEDAVEIWVGAINVLASAPAHAGTADLVTAAVAELVETHRKPVWSLLRGTGPRGTLLAMVQVPLKPARWPLLDTHLRLAVSYGRANDAGFPADGSLEALRELEDRITSLVDGAELVAHETAAGVRTFHLYADGALPAEALKPVVASWPEGRTRIEVTPDPDWTAVRHLRR